MKKKSGLHNQETKRFVKEGRNEIGSNAISIDLASQPKDLYLIVL